MTFFIYGIKYKRCRHVGLKKVKLIGCSGGVLAAINVALEYPELVDSFTVMRQYVVDAFTDSVFHGNQAAV